MAGAWVAARMKQHLLIPSTFNEDVYHRGSAHPVSSIFNMKKLRGYVTTLDVRARSVDQSARVIHLNPDLKFDLRKLPHDEDVVIHTDGWIYVDLVFPKTSYLWDAFQPHDDYVSCATSVIDKLSENCTEVHAVHMRVTDRDPFPLWDCKKPLLGKILTEQGLTIHCVFSDGRVVKISDVLKSQIKDGSCVYVATDDASNAQTRDFVKSMDSHRSFLFHDVKPYLSPMCRRLFVSILEQVIVARIRGTYVGTFPSSWDEWVYHMRDDPSTLATWKNKLRRYRTRRHPHAGQ